MSVSKVGRHVDGSCEMQSLVKNGKQGRKLILKFGQGAVGELPMGSELELQCPDVPSLTLTPIST